MAGRGRAWAASEGDRRQLQADDEAGGLVAEAVECCDRGAGDADDLGLDGDVQADSDCDMVADGGDGDDMFEEGSSVPPGMPQPPAIDKDIDPITNFPDYLCPGSLRSPGLCRISHTCDKDVCGVLGTWPRLFVMLRHVTGVFAHTGRREHWAELCIKGTAYEQSQYLFDSGCPEILEHRWGSVTQVCTWLKTRISVISMPRLRADMVYRALGSPDERMEAAITTRWASLRLALPPAYAVSGLADP